MFCRSLLGLSRFTLDASNISRRYLIASCHSQLTYSFQQQNRCIGQSSSDQRTPGRLRRFFRWFKRSPEPVERSPSSKPLTKLQRLKQTLSLSPAIEKFFLKSRIIEDEDLARLVAKTASITIYTFIGITTLGTIGVDTKPLLAGIGITGFTIGFALKEVATNFISGIFIVLNKPFVRGCRIKIHGSGGGIEGFVHLIDIRYVHLKTKDHGIVMVPSVVVYTNPFTVFPPDDPTNKDFLSSLTNNNTKVDQLPIPSVKNSVDERKIIKDER